MKLHPNPYTEADIEFAGKCKRVQELWKPQFGDWYQLVGTQKKLVLDPALVGESEVIWRQENKIMHPRYYIWLPTESQCRAIIGDKFDTLTITEGGAAYIYSKDSVFNNGKPCVSIIQAYLAAAESVLEQQEKK